MSKAWKILSVIFAALLTFELAWGDPRDAVTLLAFLTGLLLGAAPEDHPRREWLLLGVVVLALLTALLAHAVEKGWVA